MNSSLRELQLILADHVRLLSDQLGKGPTTDKARKILDEMQEFNHRVTLVGGLLFRQQSQDLDIKVEAVRHARSEVNRAIETIADSAKALQVISDFLALADEAIDLAKTLAAAAG